jgi:hypothetical protein
MTLMTCHFPINLCIEKLVKMALIMPKLDIYVLQR